MIIGVLVIALVYVLSTYQQQRKLKQFNFAKKDQKTRQEPRVEPPAASKPISPAPAAQNAPVVVPAPQAPETKAPKAPKEPQLNSITGLDLDNLPDVAAIAQALGRARQEKPVSHSEAVPELPITPSAPAQQSFAFSADEDAQEQAEVPVVQADAPAPLPPSSESPESPKAATPTGIMQPAPARPENTKTDGKWLTLVIKKPQGQMTGLQIDQLMASVDVKLDPEEFYYYQSGQKEMYRVVNIVEPRHFAREGLASFTTTGIALCMQVYRNSDLAYYRKVLLSSAIYFATELQGEICDANHQLISGDLTQYFDAQMRQFKNAWGISV